MDDYIHWMKQKRIRSREYRRDHLGLPHYTLGEELINAISHGVGALLAVAGLVVMLVYSPHDALTMVSVSVYGGTLVLLYTVSTLYHALGINQAKRVFQILDHCTIYLLIAGSYTPISLLFFGGTLGWTLFGVVWGAAVLGIVLNAVNMHRFRVFSMICYLAMGWSLVFVVGPLIESMSVTNLILLGTGGVSYTVGAVIYGKGRKTKYMHSIWHFFVLAGSVLHYFVLFSIALGNF